MPRRYRLGARAAGMEATSDRIVDAAIALYTEVGISSTTLREIGLRADVAPGTLRNHFPTRDDLDAAVVERMRREVPLPDDSIFDGAVGIEDRLARLLEAGGRFLEQGSRLYRMWQREPMVTGPWLTIGAEYGVAWDRLFQTALGPLADDQDATAVIRAIVQPSFFELVRAGHRSSDEAAALVSAVIGPWFAAREVARISEREGGKA